MALPHPTKERSAYYSALSVGQAPCKALAWLTSHVSPNKPRPEHLHQLHSQDEETEAQRGYAISSHPPAAKGQAQGSGLALQWSFEELQALPWGLRKPGLTSSR